MNDPNNNALGGLIVVLVVMTLIAAYLLHAAPVDSFLPDPNAVM
jgi:hypothetical protein